MDNTRLNFIKELHNEADKKAASSTYDDTNRVREIIQELFFAGHTDWLIEQAEKVEKLEQEIIVLKEDRGMLERDIFERVTEDAIEKNQKK